MLNNELLFVGEANPFPEATHWLTVAKSDKSYGYANISYTTSPLKYGAISPNTFGGYYISLFHYNATNTALEFCSSLPTNSMWGVDVGKLKVTRLDNGVSFTQAWTEKSGYMPTGDILGLANSNGQTIPLKIEKA